jgi:protocatechuate 3,4-dioxygenase beta subunit
VSTEHEHDDFGGLARDLPLLLQRRHVLKMLAGSTLLALAACGSDSNAATTTAAASSTTATTGATSATTGSTATTVAGTSATTAAADTASTASCTPINEETAGPYPGDGSNGPNVLTESGIVRSDITSSFGTSTTAATGVPTTVTLTVQDTANGCSALANAAVYIWHCDQSGRYSMYYSNGTTDENYLRGVQQTDADGRVTFKTIFPAAYSGRWPHMHFEIYSSLADATGGGNPITTSQLALPKDACDVVFATAGYEQSVSNLSQISLSTDMVFGDDGAAHQIPTTTGSVADGYTLQLTVPT